MRQQDDELPMSSNVELYAQRIADRKDIWTGEVIFFDQDDVEPTPSNSTLQQ